MASRRTWTVGIIAFVVILIVALTVGLVVGLSGNENDEEPSFTVDHIANTFLLNGEPFRYVAGSFHYFRALPEAWPSRLRTMRAAGLNAVDTYVEWSLHNPRDGVYDWEGIADLEKFVEYARDEGFYVILRPGPYICAERDNGGVPHWLFHKYPKIQLRTSDPDYLREVAIWYGQLMPRMEKYMIGNGGPIIMVQVENEYGVFHACDHDYLNWLRDETEKYVKGKALLFTTDIPNDTIQCGKIDGVFATTDFGIDRIHEIDDIWALLRTIQPTGPLVNSEFYPGWLTHWQEENQRRDGSKVAESLKIMLDYGASVNFYMFFGGTNFGFTAGANDFGFYNYTADITSYDYDAVMDETGAVTTKYEMVRDVIKDYLEMPANSAPTPTTPRIAYGKVKMQAISALLSTEGRAALVRGVPVESERPQSFEELDQYSGLVLYETTLPTLTIDPSLLSVAGLHDRAFVYVDDKFVGTLSRENNIYTLPLNKGWGNRLQLLVENQGRINFNVANDTKGIIGGLVTVQQRDGVQQPLLNWKSSSMPLESVQVQRLIDQFKSRGSGVQGKAVIQASATEVLTQGPVVFYGQFEVTQLGDSFLNPTGWGKGVAYVNGLNLGRYWPLAGPQITMYVPKDALRVGTNELVLLEYQRQNKPDGEDGDAIVQFDAAAQLDA